MVGNEGRASRRDLCRHGEGRLTCVVAPDPIGSEALVGGSVDGRSNRCGELAELSVLPLTSASIESDCQEVLHSCCRTEQCILTIAECRSAARSQTECLDPC